MQPHQERVIEEEKALGEKLNKLGAFIRGSDFNSLSAEHQALLREQEYHMCAYAHVLRKRIDRLH